MSNPPPQDDVFEMAEQPQQESDGNATPVQQGVEYPYAIRVINLSPRTNAQTLTEFFSFCGTIKAINVVESDPPTQPRSQLAIVAFESQQAISTALLLSKAMVDDSQIDVFQCDSETARRVLGEATSNATSGSGEQENKSKSSIVAEMLAKGYLLAGSTKQKATDYDKNHMKLGEKIQIASQKVGQSFNEFSEKHELKKKTSEAKLKVTKTTKDIDDKLHVSETGKKLWGAVSGWMSKTSDKAMENEHVNKGVGAMKKGFTSFRNSVEQVKEDTKRRISAERPQQPQPQQQQQ